MMSDHACKASTHKRGHNWTLIASRDVLVPDRRKCWFDGDTLEHISVKSGLNTTISIQEKEFENVFCKMSPFLCRHQCTHIMTWARRVIHLSRYRFFFSHVEETIALSRPCSTHVILIPFNNDPEEKRWIEHGRTIIPPFVDPGDQFPFNAAVGEQGWYTHRRYGPS